MAMVRLPLQVPSHQLTSKQGPFLVSKHFLDNLKLSSEGAIVNMSSEFGSLTSQSFLGVRFICLDANIKHRKWWAGSAISIQFEKTGAHVLETDCLDETTIKKAANKYKNGAWGVLINTGGMDCFLSI